MFILCIPLPFLSVKPAWFPAVDLSQLFHSLPQWRSLEALVFVASKACWQVSCQNATGAPEATIRKELQDRNYEAPRISQLIGQARIKREQALGAPSKVVKWIGWKLSRALVLQAPPAKQLKLSPCMINKLAGDVSRRRRQTQRTQSASKLERQELKRELNCDDESPSLTKKPASAMRKKPSVAVAKLRHFAVLEGKTAPRSSRVR